MDTPKSLHDLAAASDYDPNSMPVEKARDHIRAFLSPVTAVERLNIRAALGRVLAEDVISPINVPQHDNSAMDGYAVRFDDLKQDGEVTLKVVGTSFAGKPFHGHASDRGQAVRIMTGAVMPAGADTRHPAGTRQGLRRPGCRCAGAQERAPILRHAGEDLRTGRSRAKARAPVAPSRDRHDGVAGYRRSFRLSQAAGRVFFHRR